MGELRRNPRKIELMHQLFGRREGHTCGECSNFISGRYCSKILRKCKVYGLTHSQASDWAKRWTACGLYDKEYNRPPVIGMVKHNSFREKAPEEPLEGQITMEV